MELEFVIPLRPEELTREGNQYTIISEDRISNGERPENVIDDVAQRLANTEDEREGPLSIGEHENFDSLYYAMLHLGEMSADEKTHLMDILCKGLRAVAKSTTAMFRKEDAAKGKKRTNSARSSQQSRDEDDMDVDDNGGATDPQTWKIKLFKHRTAIKMYFWLLQWFIGLEEQTLVQKNASATIVTGSKPGARGKKKQKTSDETQSPWESEDDRIKVFSLAADVLQVDLARLWGLANPDETFLALFSKIAFNLLENPVNHKSKPMRQALFDVVRAAVIKYNQGSECGNLMMEAIRRSEAMVPHMVDLVDTIITDAHGKKAKQEYDDEEEENNDEEGPGALVPGGGATFLGDLLRDIGNLSYKELATNNTAAKAFAAFVSSVADRFPKQVLPHISLLMSHLEGEAANMRSGIMEAIGYLIHKAFATFANHADQAGEFERIKASLKVRDSLLDVLLQRIRDTTSYTRGRVLQTWVYLAENQAITKAFWQQVTAEAVGRLHDKAALVRKSAIQLLSSMLINNPFGSDLKLSQFRIQYAEAKNLAEQRAGNDLSIDRLVDIVAGNNEAAIAELNIQPDVIKIVNAFMMYRDGISFIESMHEAMPMVSTLLGSKNVSDVHEAIRFFVRAHDFHLENAKEGVRKMILLVASSQIEVKQAVIEAFSNLYMTPPPNLSEDLHPLWVAKNLISWTLDASLGELTSLEELLGAMMAQQRISSEIVQTLWEIFMQKTAAVPKAAGQAAAELAQQMQAAEGRGAIIVLSMLASTDTSIIRNHLSDVVAVGLGPRAYNDPVLAKWACIALQKLAATPPPQAVNKDGTNAAPPPISPRDEKKTKKKAPAKRRRKKRGDDSDDEEDFEDSEDEKAKSKKEATVTATMGGSITFEHTRYESTHKLFKKLTDLVETDRIPTSKWFGAAEQALNAIYLLAETPDKLMTEVIKRLAAPLFPRQFPTYYAKVAKQVKEKRERMQQLSNQNDGMDVDEENGEAQIPQMNGSKVDHAATDIGQLARLLFVLGHTAMKQLVYIDAIVRHVKIRTEAKEKKKAAAAARRPAAGRKSMGGDEEPEAIEKELGVTAADAEDEQMRRRAEDAVVCDNLVGSFSNLVVSVCADAVKFNDPYVRFAAVNALCKYMLVSERFCEENLQLLFSILQGPDPASLRASIAISLGDLNVRFPNKIELWRDHFYGRLSDPDVTVRKNTLMVLTHLILHDMIKPKEHISAMAMCLEDKEQRISDLARLFFYELASKENASAIYNIIPGMIGGLSQVTNLPFESVQNIVRYLFSFIQKEKHLESLIDKLCQRFVLSDTKQCEYVAYCLSCLPNWSDRSVKRLADLFNKYKEALNTPLVFDHFQSILAKARKNAKADMKTVIDELEVKINDAVDPEKIDAARALAAAQAAARGEAGADEDDEAPKRGRGRGKRAPAKRAGAKKAGRGGKAGRGRGRGRRAFEDDDEEDEDDLLDDSDEDEEEIVREIENQRAKSAPRGAKKAGAKKTARAAESDDDEDDSATDESEDEAPAPKKAAPKKAGGAKKAAAKPRAKKATSSDDDDDDVMDVDDDDDVMDVDDEPPAKAPRQARAAAPRKKQIIEDSEDDEDDDDD